MRYLLRSLLCVSLSFCIVFSSSYSALASTTTSQAYSLNSRSIPNNYNLTCSVISLDKNSNSLRKSSSFNLVDGSDSTIAELVTLSGNTGDCLVGFTLSFDSFIDGSFYSQHIIDISPLSLRIFNNNLQENWFNLSPFAVPIYAYAVYDGTFDFQIYDGSAGYERWIYDNNFTLTKPIQIQNTNFGQFYSDSRDGFDCFLKTPAISSSDILNITGYKNLIADRIDFEKTVINDIDFVTIEDFPTENIRIANDNITIYVLYSVDNTTFEPFADRVNDIELPVSLDNCTFQVALSTSKYYDYKTSVNVNSVPYLDDDNAGLSFIANGFYNLKNSLGSGISNVVTNATDNANRIIQNTTQKVDDVKQGVTEVKDSVIETKNSILDLPNKIKDMLIGLVVPDEETINAKYNEFDELLSSRFGLIYQSAQIIHDFADSFQTQALMTADTGGIITMPSVTVNLAGTQFTFGGYDVDIIPNGFEFLQQALRLAISMVCTVVFVNMCKNKLEAILK